MTTTAPITSDARRVEALAGKYLTLMLGREAYGIPVLKVREIIRHTSVIAVPQTPDYIQGVMNLRGKVIAIADLRMRFHLPHTDVAARTCVVVVLVALKGGTSANMGLVVDGVESVASISAGEIEPTPDFGGQTNTECILGMAKLGDRVVALLDIDKVIGAETIQEIQRSVHSGRDDRAALRTPPPLAAP